MKTNHEQAQGAVYESPVVLDFGSVLEVTCGNGSEYEDKNGQEFD